MTSGATAHLMSSERMKWSAKKREYDGGRYEGEPDGSGAMVAHRTTPRS